MSDQNKDLPPLPEPSQIFGYGYTADQMRERDAMWAEQIECHMKRCDEMRDALAAEKHARHCAAPVAAGCPCAPTPMTGHVCPNPATGKPLCAAPVAEAQPVAQWCYETMGLPNEEVAEMWRASGHSGVVPYSFANRIEERLRATPAPQEVGQARDAGGLPDEMTPEMMRAVQLHSELGAYAAANLTGAYDLFREFWKVAAMAAQSDDRAVGLASLLNATCLYAQVYAAARVIHGWTHQAALDAAAAAEKEHGTEPCRFVDALRSVLEEVLRVDGEAAQPDDSGKAGA